MATSASDDPRADEREAREPSDHQSASEPLDRLRIQECIAAYCRGLDRLDAELLASAFHPDATYHHPAFQGDLRPSIDWAIGLMMTFERTHHGITTQSIEINGDEAHAESYCLFSLLPKDGSVLCGGMARYIDRLERRDGRWAIATRVALIDNGFETRSVDWQHDPVVMLPNHRDRTDSAYARPLRRPLNPTS